MFEYMGKELFAKFGLPVPKGRMVTTSEGAALVAEEIGGPVVIKSQVLSGKRGKAGAATEFGAKISVSLVNGFSYLDRLSWDAYNESGI